MRRLLISLTLVACAAPAAADVLPHRATGSPILGRWVWKSDKGDCTETHEYLPNGVKRTQSGQEALEKSYAISRIRGVTGVDQYLMSETTTKANGKADCTGAVSKVGQGAELYLFVESPDKYITCATSNRNTCYGVAMRQK